MNSGFLLAAYPVTILIQFGLWVLRRNSLKNLLPALAALPLICLLFFLFSGVNQGSSVVTFPFLSISGGINLQMVFLLDPLRLMLLLLLAFLCFLIQIYSLGYLKKNDSQPYFHFLLVVFQAAMAGLFLAGNLFSLFIFWELVGLLSWLLVQFWYQDQNVVQAGLWVLLINKAGDILLLGGIGLLCSFGLGYPVFNNIYFPEGADVFMSSSVGKVICTFFLVSAAVKSAQFPFSVWLKKAMAGPAAVSALLHSATMVAAGVWLITRVGPFFPETVLHWLGYLGMVTLLIGNLAAVLSNELKSTLAFSTIAQLGLMMAAAGDGQFDAANLHLMAHAFFKSGLFLLCGLLMKQLSDRGLQGNETQLYRNLSGILRHNRLMKISAGILLAALAGIPLSSGFISKEGIMPSPWQSNDGYAWCLFVTMQAGAFLTALYAGRIFLVLVVEKGEDKVPPFPLLLSLPIGLLALLSTFLLFGYHPFSSEGWLTAFTGLAGKQVFPDVLAAGAGLLTAWILRNRLSSMIIPSGIRQLLLDFTPVEFLLQKSGRLLWIFASGSRKADDKILDAALIFSSRFVVVGGYFAAFTDRFIIDGLLKTGGRIFYTLGALPFRMATQPARFVAWFALLILILLIYFSYFP